MIRTITAAVLVLGVLVPVAAGKPEYTAACNRNTHDVTLTWTGGTDVTARATLEWADGTDETVNVELPKQGGLRAYTWTNVGSQSGPLAGVVAQFVRNNGSLPPSVRVSCSQ